MDKSFVSGVMSGSMDKLLTPSHLNSFKNLSRKAFLSLLKTHQFGLASDTNMDQIMLEEELKHKKNLLSIIDANNLVFKVLYLNFDHLFLSNLMKSFHLKLKYHKYIDGLSNMDEKRYEDYVFNDVVGLLDLEDVEFLKTLKEETKNLDAQDISDQVIKILHQHIIHLMDKKTDKNLVKYLNLKTTILNIMLLIRSKTYDKDQTYFESNILEGGMIDKHILFSLYDQSIETFGQYLKLHFDVRLTDIFKHVGTHQFLDMLNKGFKIYEDDLLEDLSFELSNLAPVIYYTILKRNELRHLKEMFYEIKE